MKSETLMLICGLMLCALSLVLSNQILAVVDWTLGVFFIGCFIGARL